MIENNGKKVLVLGGTGAMGVYLVPELASMGYLVHVVSLDKVESNNPNIVYMQGNAKDDEYLKILLKNEYDAIIDFMCYLTEEFSKKYKLFLENTDHYIFLSSYRVYADKEIPITEKSPRLLDVSDDKEYLATEDYSLYKAREENILRASDFDNWTIVRPAITYSKFRYQLVTLESNTVIYRAFNKKTIVLPEEAKDIQGTMSWAGDVAKMFSRIILNKAAYKETYTLSTSEHHTWNEIAEYYKELIGLNYVWVDTSSYLKFFDISWRNAARYQLLFDRCFNRIIDNTKILQVTGLKQSDFITLKQGLKKELSIVPKDTNWGNTSINDKMDEFLKGYDK
jgi:nucleoside-diphosphate-sugar epimerase